MKQPIHRLVYVSAATRPFSQADLLGLLARAREKNQRLGITGMLLYKDGDFMQLLEGERAAVRALFDTIGQDPRHQGTIVIAEEDTDGRVFEGWSMGFRELSDPDVHRTPGYSHYMNTPLVADRLAQSPSEALELLSLFKPKY